MYNNVKWFVGIDVQVRRGCCYYVLDDSKNCVTNGWVKTNTGNTFREKLLALSGENRDTIAVGIDAPRMPLKTLRRQELNKITYDWIMSKKPKVGRTCEVWIKALKLGNPQWTRTSEDSPKWMQLGFLLFESLIDFPYVYEVFPTASYKILSESKATYHLCLKNFFEGPKDMLDASVAAFTVYEFIKGRGYEVGGEDGLGSIILPKKPMQLQSLKML